jgi:hypothetical protein
LKSSDLKGPLRPLFRFERSGKDCRPRNVKLRKTQTERRLSGNPSFSTWPIRNDNDNDKTLIGNKNRTISGPEMGKSADSSEFWTKNAVKQRIPNK